MCGESKKTSYSVHIPYCCSFVPVSVDSDLLNVSTTISQGKIKAEHMLCYSAIGMLLLLQIDGTQHLDPPGFLTHSHTAMEAASHHCNQDATVSFHGLAERQPLKQENHTCSIECSSISELIWRIPFQATALESKGKTVQKILELKHHHRAGHLVFKLFGSGSSNLNNSPPLRNDQYAALATRHNKI